MKTITVHTWRIRTETHRKPHWSRWKMTEEDAKALDPLAEPRPGSAEVRKVYEPGEELPPAHSTAFGGARR